MPVQDRPTGGENSSHDLWNKALDTLGVELKDSLDLKNVSRGTVLSKALEEARGKKQVCAQKCWTLKKRNGETIILRDVVEKIIVWVEKFIAVGDAAMQYDTVHAAPAWAAFRFVLQLAVNDKRALGETIENLETVSHLITRYAILEELYLQRNSAAREKIEDMVVRLYAEILTFLARARKYFQSTAKIRLAMSIVKFPEDAQMARINVLDGQISMLIEVFTVDVQIDTANGVAAMNSILTSLNEPIKRLVDHSSISVRAIQESQHLQLLNWLSPVPFSSHHKRHSESRIPGSGQWLLGHDRYLDWRNTSSSSMFLLHGLVGSGKTSLASAVVDSFLQESSGQTSPAPIAYFYCTKSSAETERNNPDEIMRCVLRQLTVSHGSSSTIHERVLQEYERRQAVAKVDGFEVTRLQAAECVKLILDTTAANPATIVLDAVDEIQPSSRHILISALIQIVRDSLSVVKVFVTSRDDSNIHAQLSDAVAVRIENEHTRKDMDDFVHQEVASAIRDRRMLNGVVSDNLKQGLMSALINGAGEMFLWVVRQIENLCRMKTEADIRSAMRALPKSTLNELYEEDFDRMSKSGQHTRSFAIQVFSILLCTQEALSPEALFQATAKTISQQEETMTLAKVIDICFNLVVLDSELNVLRFAYVSFPEFLETRAEFAPHYVHRVAASSCLDFCLEGLPRGMETDLSPKDNFHHYSAVYWAEHCRVTVFDGAENLITSKMQEFVFDGGDVALGFVDWIQELNNLTKILPNDHVLAKELRSVIHSGGSPLFTACVFGLAPIIGHLEHETEYDWKQTNDLGQNGLYLAAAFGHKTIVQSLLQHDVYVNAFCGKFGHPLHAACFGGHAGIVELLLGQGADPKLGPRNALEYALLADHENVALLLLDGKFDVADQAEYDSILQQAAEAGFADVVQFLQKKYASLYGDLGSSRCRAVEVAIFKGRTGVVERYMQKLSDPRVDMPEDAIAIAALGGQDTMINLLVDQRLDLNKEGVLGTPLRAASVMCHESTVRLLLRLGASLHVSGSFGEPLQAAAMRGHELITRTLLSHGGDVNSRGGLYGTALQAAAHRGHQKVVEILLDAGADVYRDGFSRDAFHAASEGGHEGIVRLLLQRGFKVQHALSVSSLRNQVTPSQYRDLLRDASPSRLQQTKPTWDHQPESDDWRERASVVDFSHVAEKMRGAVTSEPDLLKPYRERFWDRIPAGENYALLAAAANGHVAVVELLLSQLDKMDIWESEVVAAFREACENGHEKVVSQLLSDRVEVEDLNAALEAAALKGHLTVVNLLIDHEDRLGLERVETFESTFQGTYECDSTARAILNSGSRGGNLPIFRRGQDLVAQRCTDVASRHLQGEALATAATNCKFDVMEALLESNSDFVLPELTKTLNSVCAWGSEEALQLVLKHDAKKVLGIQHYSSGLSHAALKHNRQIVVHWLEEHPDHHDLVVDPTTVIDVSGNGFVDILPPLIEQIRPPDSFEKAFSQCLQIAARNGHEEVVEYLIGEGADVNIVVEQVGYTSVGNRLDDGLFYQKDGSTRKLSALQAAMIGFERFGPMTDHGHLRNIDSSWTTADVSSQQRVVEILLAKGADPNGADEHERSPLNIAATYCTVQIVQELISLGARTEPATKEHGTALQAAARRELGGLPIIKALLEANALAPSIHPEIGAALNEALSFFKSSRRLQNSGSFEHSASIMEVLSTGPGPAVKILLANLPEEKADDSRYGLLAQMACVAGDQEWIELLLQRGIDVNGLGYYYGTALQAASRVGNTEIVERLLNSGADVNILHGVHGTALRAAALGGHEDLVRSLIAHGADVNLRDKDWGESILHLALKSRNHATFKTLLVAGANMNTEMHYQQHILISACAAGHLPVVQLLLDHGADIEKTDGLSGTPLIAAIRGEKVQHAIYFTPLLEATKDCKLEIVKELLSAGATIGGLSTKSNALAEACNSRQHMVIELLLETLSGTQYEAEICGEALSAAIKSGNDDMACLLLEHGMPPSFEMLRQACSAGVLETVKMLVDKGIHVDEDDGNDAPLLHVAASHSRPDIVHFLIDRGAAVMLRSTKYGSPLIAALEGFTARSLRGWWQSESCRSLAEQLPLPEPSCYKEVSDCQHTIRSLFDADAEVDTTIRSFGNALHLASYMGSEVIVRQLLEKMEDINIFGGYFGSPLIAGLKGNHPIIVELLLDRGIEVNHCSSEHGSALHCACVHGNKKMTQSLLDHGADINAYNDKHGSALTAAASYAVNFRQNRGPISPEEQRAIVELLLRHEPKVQIRECDLLAAASWEYSSDGQPFMSLFLSHDQSAVATEAVIVKAIENHNKRITANDDTMQLLLGRDGGLGTTPAMLKATNNVDAMEMLLKHEPICQVTADILDSAAKQDIRLVKMLLTHDPKVFVTETTIIAAVRHTSPCDSDGTALKLLLDQNLEIKSLMRCWKLQVAQMTWR